VADTAAVDTAVAAVDGSSAVEVAESATVDGNLAVAADTAAAAAAAVEAGGNTYGAHK